MNPDSKKNIFDVLQKLHDMLSSNKIIVSELKALSNKLMEDVTLFCDKDSISVSVLVYALYKIFSKDSKLEKASLKKLVKTSLSSIDNEAKFRTSIRKLFDNIKKYDKNLDYTILQTIRHAQIKKGLKVYEHGLSIGQASEIMGVSKWDMIEYLGDSYIVDDAPGHKVDFRERLDFARGLFQ
jgi:tRNA U34 5-carboxymethylaminomethyl modifying enzyme MnmG/GidA